MPYDEAAATDPDVLVGVEVDGLPGTVEDMAYTFAEEMARTGMPEARILRLFRSSFYVGPHSALQALGAARVAGIIRESVEAFGGARFVVHDAPRSQPEED